MHDFKRRASIFRKDIIQRKLDAFFVNSEINVTYLTGFLGGESPVLFANGKFFLIADSRNYEDAKRSAGGCEVLLNEAGLFETIRNIVIKTRVRRLGFESMQMPYAYADRLKKMLPSCALIPVSDLVEGIRSVKEPYEVTLIERSAALTKKVLGTTLRRIDSGLSEKEFAQSIELAFLKKGARLAFQSIIASGTSSSMPHSRPTGRVVKKDDLVMIDLGCSLDMYCSDMTRTRLPERAGKRLREIYDVVSEAQSRAIAKIRPGELILDIDNEARSFIEKRGFGNFFGHALGHGVGLAVHESPSISKRGQGVLKEGMVFTVEPAIYISGVGGVRIEDMVVVTKNGCRVITK